MGSDAQEHTIAGPKLRIGVMGAGAIGAFVGARVLSSGAAHVTFVGRSSFSDSVAKDGLRVSAFGHEVRIEPERIQVATEPGALRDCDVVLVAVKSGSTAEVARSMAPFLRDDAVVVSLQNGVRNAEVLREHLPAHRVIPAVVGFNVVVRDRTTFALGLTGPLVVEAEDSLDRTWVRALERGGLDVEVANPIAAEQWTKLLTNLNNAIAALSGASTPELLLKPGYRRLIHKVLDEARSVLRDAGIPTARFRGVPLSVMATVLKLPTPLVRVVLRAQLKMDDDARASMWTDLERGRRTEVDHINGEIVRLAESLGRDAPLNRRLVELVHRAEQAGQGSPSLDPVALAAAVLRGS